VKREKFLFQLAQYTEFEVEVRIALLSTRVSIFFTIFQGELAGFGFLSISIYAVRKHEIPRFVGLRQK